MNMLAIYGSPRVNGNSDTLLDEFCRGAESAGARVTKKYLRDMDIMPCTECGSCDDTGVCIYDDDYQDVYNMLGDIDAMIVASPIFFYGVSAITKAFIDRSQAFYMNKYYVEPQLKEIKKVDKKKGYFLSCGATQGKSIFEGPRYNMKYFYDAINFNFVDSLLFKGLDKKGEAGDLPALLKECYDAGVNAAKQ